MIEIIDHLVHDFTGLVHLFAATIGLITGTLQLVMTKGTSIHRKIGFVYVASISVLLITAFLIYRLFGRFGIFHIFAVISAVTLICGFVPVLIKMPEDSWLELHFSFMYWSVMGLYMAFVAEVLTRVPETPFFGMVGLATGVIGLGAGFYFYTNKERWAE